MSVPSWDLTTFQKKGLKRTASTATQNLGSLTSTCLTTSPSNDMSTWRQTDRRGGAHVGLLVVMDTHDDRHRQHYFTSTSTFVRRKRNNNISLSVQ